MWHTAKVMSQLSQIFGATIGSTVARTNKPKARQESETQDALTDSYLPPSDSVDLRSTPPSWGSTSNSFGFAQLQSQAGLPKLSNAYSSHTGGMLDIKA